MAVADGMGIAIFEDIQIWSLSFKMRSDALSRACGTVLSVISRPSTAGRLLISSRVIVHRNVESNKQRNTSKTLSEENGRAKPSQLDSNDADEEHEEGTEEEQERDRSRHPEDFDDGDAFMQKMRQQMLNKKKALEKSSSSHANSSSKASSHHSHRNESSGRKRRSRGNESEDSLDSTGEDETRHPTRKGGRSKGGEPVSKAGKGDKEQEQEQQDEDETEREKARRKAIKERAKEYEALRAELKAKHRAAKIMTGDEREKYDAVSFTGKVSKECTRLISQLLRHPCSAR